MTRDQIIERVARKAYEYYLHETKDPDQSSWDELSQNDKDFWAMGLEKTLQFANYFELREVVELLRKRYCPSIGHWQAIGKCKYCGTKTTTISIPVCDECLWKRVDQVLGG